MSISDHFMQWSKFYLNAQPVTLILKYIFRTYELIIALLVFLKHQSLLEKSRLNTEKTALIMGQHTTPRWPEIRPLTWFLDRVSSQFYFTPLK